MSDKISSYNINKLQLVCTSKSAKTKNDATVTLNRMR